MSTTAFRAMGCEIVVGGATAAEIAAIERLFVALETALSRFRPDSELQRLNGSPCEAVIASPILAAALENALRAAEATDGRVDPTIGEALARRLRPLVRRHREAPVRPAVPAGRWREVRLTGSLVRRPVGLTLDLNGVVKGQAVDDALALIEETASSRRAAISPHAARSWWVFPGTTRSRSARAHSRRAAFRPGRGNVRTVHANTTSSTPEPALPPTSGGSRSPSAPRRASPPTWPRKRHSCSVKTDPRGSSGTACKDVSSRATASS